MTEREVSELTRIRKDPKTCRWPVFQHTLFRLVFRGLVILDLLWEVAWKTVSPICLDLIQHFTYIQSITHSMPNIKGPPKPLKRYVSSFQGPDKILTFGADVCADPDNFRIKNPDIYVPQSGHFGGVRLATNYDFSRACWHVCGESDNFSHLAEVCVAVRTISGRNYFFFFCLRTILVWADTYLPLRGSWYKCLLHGY